MGYIDGATLLWLELIVLVAAFVQGTVGFAFGMIAMGASAFLIDARTASLLMAPVAGANVAMVLWSVRREINLRVVAPMVAGLIIGLPFGLALLLGGGSTVIRVLISALLIYVGVTRLVPRRAPLRPVSSWWGSVAGLVAGVLGGATNISGPPLVAYAARQPWPPGAFKAALLSTFMVSTLVKTATLIWHGALDRPLLVVAGALLPAAIGGSLVGVLLFRRLDAERFGQVIAVMVIVLGIGLLL